MYESFLRVDDELKPFLADGPDPALFHRGDYQRLLRVHERNVAQLFNRGGREGMRALDRVLRRRIADSRTLRVAADHLRVHGGRAPGVNGRRLADMDSAEIWSCCRALAAALRAGTYRPGPDRRVRIPKEGKPGQFRELTIRNVEDRLIGRAILLVLRPILERLFSPFSFGFRPGRGAQHALATALALARRETRWHWVCADVEKAFDRIPHARLLDACRRLFPDEVVELIGLVSYTGRKRGIRQGSPDSPAYANVFFDRYLDEPWRRAHPDVPLIRYADDLLLLCRSVTEAESARAALTRMAVSAGTPLKPRMQVVDLRNGQPIEWMGFLLQRQDKRLAIQIADGAWERLGFSLAKAHLAPGSPLRAVQIIQGWLNHMGPGYMHEDREAVIGRIAEVSAEQAFEEIPGERELTRRWATAHARWCRLLDQQALLLPGRLQAIRPQVDHAARD